MIYYESIGTKVVGKTITREKFAKIFDMRYKNLNTKASDSKMRTVQFALIMKT